MAATTNQTGLKSFATGSITDYALFLGGLDVTRDVLKAYDPFKGGFGRIFMTRGPVFIEENPDTLASFGTKEKLVEALQLLTEKEQKVVTLYYYEDLTLKEIANILEVSESRVSQLHTKALQKMKYSSTVGSFSGQIAGLALTLQPDSDSDLTEAAVKQKLKDKLKLKIAS